MALEMDGPAPYAPPLAVIVVIERYRDKGLPTPFTRDVLARAGVSDSLTARTLQALKILGLVDESGEPEQPLRAYAQAPADEAKSILADLIRTAYAPIFRFVVPGADSFERVQDQFRGYEPRGQRDRMVTLFVGLCEYAGIIPEGAWRPPGSSGRPTADKASGSRKSVRASKPAGKPPVNKVPDTVTVDELPSAIQGLVRDLAKIGPTWTKERRNQFVTLLEAAIDFSYPPQESQDSGLANARS